MAPMLNGFIPVLLVIGIIAGVDCVANFDCDFESNLCGWVPSSPGKFSWKRNQKGTPSAGTGPVNDASGNPNGYFVNVHVTEENTTSTVSLISPLIVVSPSGSCKLNISYSLYKAKPVHCKNMSPDEDCEHLKLPKHKHKCKKAGAICAKSCGYHCDQLRVLIRQGDTAEPIYDAIGHTDNQWTNKAVHIDNTFTGAILVVIEATTGWDKNAYIAVDNLFFTGCDFNEVTGIPVTTPPVTTLPDPALCPDSSNICSRHAACTFVKSKFTCVCKPGYTGDGNVCDDINECQIGTDTCDTYANCTNTEGSFKCACKEGFVGNGDKCTDIEECPSLPCKGRGSTCIETPGSFECRCPDGLKGDGLHSCNDGVPCLTNKNVCSKDAKCDFQSRGFNCKCKTGYTGDGLTCTDIDECASNIDNCNSNAGCRNLPGSFQCTCNSGYTGSGTKCEEITTGTPPAKVTPTTPVPTAPVIRAIRVDKEYQVILPNNLNNNPGVRKAVAASLVKQFRLEHNETALGKIISIGCQWKAKSVYNCSLVYEDRSSPTRHKRQLEDYVKKNYSSSKYDVLENRCESNSITFYTCKIVYRIIGNSRRKRQALPSFDQLINNLIPGIVNGVRKSGASKADLAKILGPNGKPLANLTSNDVMGGNITFNSSIVINSHSQRVENASVPPPQTTITTTPTNITTTTTTPTTTTTTPITTTTPTTTTTTITTTTTTTTTPITITTPINKTTTPPTTTPTTTTPTTTTPTTTTPTTTTPTTTTTIPTTTTNNESTPVLTTISNITNISTTNATQPPLIIPNITTISTTQIPPSAFRVQQEFNLTLPRELENAQLAGRLAMIQMLEEYVMENYTRSNYDVVDNYCVSNSFTIYTCTTVYRVMGNTRRKRAVLLDLVEYFTQKAWDIVNYIRVNGVSDTELAKVLGSDGSPMKGLTKSDVMGGDVPLTFSKLIPNSHRIISIHPYPNSTSPPHTTSMVEECDGIKCRDVYAPIAGASAGVLFLIGAIIFILMYNRRLRKEKQSDAETSSGASFLMSSATNQLEVENMRRISALFPPGQDMKIPRAKHIDRLDLNKLDDQPLSLDNVKFVGARKWSPPLPVPKGQRNFGYREPTADY